MAASDDSIALRPVCPEDRGFLSDVYASTRTGELAVVDWSEQEKSSFLLSQFEAQTSSWDESYPDADRSIVVVDGVPAGRLYLDRRPDEIRIVDIALLPEHRGGGVGTHLLEAVMEEARAVGVAVRIHAEKSNPAMRLYRRLGFRTIRDVGVYDLMEWLPVAEDRGGPGNGS